MRASVSHHEVNSVCVPSALQVQSEGRPTKSWGDVADVVSGVLVLTPLLMRSFGAAFTMSNSARHRAARFRLR